MKIKQRKYMSEKEALHWLVDNFETNGGLEREGVFYKVEFIDEGHKLCWTKDGRYYIDEEVEITEETVLKSILIIDSCDDIYQENHFSIRNAKGDYSNIKFIYLQNEDGSIGELIWEDGEMVDKD